MFSAFRLSSLLFLFTGVLFLLQLFPYTGVVLMLFAAPFWSVITVNLAFFLMIIEGLFKLSARWTLIFPAVYFGGYFLIAGLGHYQYHSLKQEIFSQNSTVKIPFDPKKDALVVPDNYTSSLVSLYGIDAIYTPNETDIPMKHASIRIAAEEACRGLRGGYLSGVYTSPIWSAQTNGCLVRYAESVPWPFFEVTSKSERGGSWILPLEKETITIIAPDKQKYTLVAGRAFPFSWIPQPVLGCALNSGAPAWECTHTFTRENGRPLNVISETSKGSAAAIAYALGLKNISLEEKVSRAPKIINKDAIAQRNQADKLSDSYKRFQKLISNPVEYQESLDFSLLLKDSEYLTSNAGKMMDALKALTANPVMEKKRFALYELISQLPISEFSKITPRLIEILTSKTEANITGDLITNDLIIRMGDVGGPEVENLFGQILNNRDEVFHTNYPVILGICRGGPQMQKRFGDVLIKKLVDIKGYHQNDLLKRLLIITLYRIGLKNEADEILTLNEVNDSLPGDKEILPVSPPSVCVFSFNNGVPKFPD